MSRGALRLNGALALVLSVLLALTILDWQIGPEFWLAVPALAALGLWCWSAAGRG